MTLLKINKETKIYVACPPNFETGGPEALHSLAYELRNLGFEALIYYVDASENENPVAKRFIKFNIPYVFEIEDNRNNILIIPEVWGHLLYNYKKIQKVFWWLSVDNYFYEVAKQKQYHGLMKIYKKIFPKNRREVNFKNKKILHLAQSQYAMDFLKKKGVKNKAFLADYLRDEFFEGSFDINKKENIVLYNPKKGYEFTRKIIENSKDINFIPLINLTCEQVKELCHKSKIYIDFGNHPGKDRFPREAAISGNIIITGKKGAAAFFEDIPIPDCYKFDDEDENLSVITSRIEDCLSNYEKNINDFDYYRKFITADKENFISDIKEIFPLP